MAEDHSPLDVPAVPTGFTTAEALALVREGRRPRPDRSTRPFTVRAVAGSDFGAWLPLWEGYNAFYGRSGATALPEAVTRTTWSRFLDPAEPVHALVADDAGQLLGLAHYIFHRSTTMIGRTCYMQDLFTDPAARGRGIAAALIAAVCEEARRAGAGRVYWQTHESNATARRLYDRVAERSGFIVYRIAL
jgi:GNAT superfamily N-acetyltransferase